MKWGSRALVAAILAGLGAIGAFSIAPVGSVSPPLFYNMSMSLPRGLYFARKVDAVCIGDLIRVCAPPPAASEALARSYLLPGPCAGGTAPVGKMVAALAHDTVYVDDRGVRVRGRLLEGTAPQPRDSRGRRVRAAAPRLVLKEAECFVVSTYDAMSYDSRYFGPVACPAPQLVLTPLGRRARRMLKAHGEALR